MVGIENLRLLFAFIAAGLITFAATPAVSSLSTKLGAVDVPKDGRRMHTKPIPRMGGLAIFYGFIVAVMCFMHISIPVRGILIGAIIITTLGIIDDMSSLPALFKLLVQLLAAFIVVKHGIIVNIITNPFTKGYIELGGWSTAITMLWIVGITNAINLLDGLDGLAVGITNIISITLLVISIIMGNSVTALLAVCLAGSGFGFLPYNFNPAKIFMGDTGSTFLGFVLACISVMGLFKIYAVISFAVPFLLLGLPIFDTSFAIIRRLVKGQSPMSPDRGHLHHRLIDYGFSHRNAVLILYALSSLLSLSAIVMMISDAVKGLVFILAISFLSFATYKLVLKERKK